METIDRICNGTASIIMTKAEIPKQIDGKALPDYILDLCAKHPDRTFLTQPMGKDAPVKKFTFGEFLSGAKKMAAYIESLELPVPSQIAIMSKNCAWWLMADLAIMITGHIGVPIYPTLTAETTKYTLEHCEAKLLFVGKFDTKPWAEMKKGIPEGLKCVSFPLCPEGLDYDKWDDLTGQQTELKETKKRTMEELATIIYTSGSTGVPKGVMLSFNALTTTSFGLVNASEITCEDRYISYLPVSHGMERWVGECVPFVTGLQVFFAESLATFVDDLNRAKPTLFLSVPRLWTKFQEGVFKKMPPAKLEKILKIPILSYFVKRKLLKKLGLDSVRYAGSGSAPLPPDLLAWYRALGLELNEGYGMTENFNYSHMSKPGRGRVGYVGEPHEGVEQRIAEDGEIQVKSPGTMMGYFHNEEATKESIMEGGWLRTGDKGTVDEEGRLKITGRTKEIFKTSKGKYVAPAPIENQYIAHPRVELACVGGRGHPAAHIVVLLGDEAKKAASTEEGKAVIEKELEEHLGKVNGGLDDHERLQFIAIINDEWLPENGFCTPTNKIKRAKIEEEYIGNLDVWYDSKKKVIWHQW